MGKKYYAEHDPRVESSVPSVGFSAIRTSTYTFDETEKAITTDEGSTLWYRNINIVATPYDDGLVFGGIEILQDVAVMRVSADGYMKETGDSTNLVVSLRKWSPTGTNVNIMDKLEWETGQVFTVSTSATNEGTLRVEDTLINLVAGTVIAFVGQVGLPSPQTVVTLESAAILGNSVNAVNMLLLGTSDADRDIVWGGDIDADTLQGFTPADFGQRAAANIWAGANSFTGELQKQLADNSIAGDISDASLWPNGFSMMVVSGTNPTYPIGDGTVVTFKASDTRIFQVFNANGNNQQWIRSLYNQNSVSWVKVYNEDFQDVSLRLKDNSWTGTNNYQQQPTYASEGLATEQYVNTRSNAISGSWDWNETTTGAPGVGHIGGNAILLENITQIRVSKTTKAGDVLTGSNLEVDDSVVLISKDRSQAGLYTVGAPGVDQGTYIEAVVTFRDGSGGNPLSEDAFWFAWIPQGEYAHSHNATQIAFDPSFSPLTTADVQLALDEVANKYARLDGAEFTGKVAIKGDALDALTLKRALSTDSVGLAFADENGIPRWLLHQINNAGCNLYLQGRQADGLFQWNALIIDNITGVVNCPEGLQSGGNDVYHAANPPPATAHNHDLDYLAIAGTAVDSDALGGLAASAFYSTSNPPPLPAHEHSEYYSPDNPPPAGIMIDIDTLGLTFPVNIQAIIDAMPNRSNARFVSGNTSGPDLIIVNPPLVGTGMYIVVDIYKHSAEAVVVSCTKVGDYDWWIGKSTSGVWDDWKKVYTEDNPPL